MAEEPQIIQANLLLLPFNTKNPRPLDPRVTAQPKALLAGAGGTLVFRSDGLEWTPSHLHPRFHPIQMPWADIMHVQLVSPEDFLEKVMWAQSRESNGYLRVFCWSGLIEFSFFLVDAETIFEALIEHLESGQVQAVSPGAT